MKQRNQTTLYKVELIVKNFTDDEVCKENELNKFSLLVLKHLKTFYPLKNNAFHKSGRNIKDVKCVCV